MAARPTAAPPSTFLASSYEWFPVRNPAKPATTVSTKKKGNCVGSVIYTYVTLKARQPNTADGGTSNSWVTVLIGGAPVHQCLRCVHDICFRQEKTSNFLFFSDNSISHMVILLTAATSSTLSRLMARKTPRPHRTVLPDTAGSFTVRGRSSIVSLDRKPLANVRSTPSRFGYMALVPILNPRRVTPRYHDISCCHR